MYISSFFSIKFLAKLAAWIVPLYLEEIVKHSTSSPLFIFFSKASLNNSGDGCEVFGSFSVLNILF
jgi:hypothetical protein